MPQTFDIPIESLEVSFTFLYDLGGPVRRQDELITGANIDSRETWPEAEISHYIDRRALEQLVCAHFHIVGLSTTPLAVQSNRELATWLGETKMGRRTSDSEPKRYYFAFPTEYLADVDGGEKTEIRSIAAIEVSIYPTGYLAIVLRVRNQDRISAINFVDLIRHPEHYKSVPTTTLKAGELVEKAECYVHEHVEPCLQDILPKLNIDVLHSNTGSWSPLKVILANVRDGAAHVGTILSLPNTDDSQPIDRDLIQRFVIACFRTTPAFLESFSVNESDYLRNKGRDIYGAGNSILAVGSRGFCAFDAEMKSRKAAFRIGVVETTHFLANVIRTAKLGYLRALLTFGSDSEETFDNLYEDLLNRTFSVRRSSHSAEKFVARAKRFRPRGNSIRMLRAVVYSHSGRTAFERLNHLHDLEPLSRKTDEAIQLIDHELQVLRDRNQHRSARWTFIAATIAMVGLVIILTDI